MGHFMKKIIIVVTTSLLGGCASFENRTSAEKFSFSADDRESAIVIISLGAPTRCISFVPYLKLLPSQASYRDKAVTSLAVDNYAIKSEFTDHHGYLDVLK